MENKYVIPGEIIFEDGDGFMKGYGVTTRDKSIISTVRGKVEVVGKLVVVNPLTSIYSPNVGDIVVGRISQVQKQKWKVQIGTSVLADLRLSSIYLPDSEIRRRTTADERNMRQYFDVGDLICAEVQNVSNEISLHTREQHPKRLHHGILVEVPSRLIKRVPAHMDTISYMESKFNIIYGLNGSIWISPIDDSGDHYISRIRANIILLATYNQLIFTDKLRKLLILTSEIDVQNIVSIEVSKLLYEL